MLHGSILQHCFSFSISATLAFYTFKRALFKHLSKKNRLYLYPNKINLKIVLFSFKNILFSNHCLCHNISDLLVRDDLREQLRRRGDLGQRRGLPPHRRACDEPRSRSTPPLAHVQLRTLQLLRTVCVRCKKLFIFVTLKPSSHERF